MTALNRRLASDSLWDAFAAVVFITKTTPRTVRQRTRIPMATSVGWAEPDVNDIRTPPYTPKTNGEAERFIQTLLREWAYALPYKTSDRSNADLPRWLRLYNEERPHASLGNKPPISRLKPAQ